MDDITILKLTEDDTVTNYGMTTIYSATLNDVSKAKSQQANLSQDQSSFSFENESQMTTSKTKTPQAVIPPNKTQAPPKPIFCNEQQLFQSKVLSKHQIRQKIKNIFN